jgi:hypothetical protein
MKNLILDSGAFSVWNNGASIDLDAYIEFCAKYPHVSYYVNLDVIPGLPNQKRTLNPASVDESCKKGWDNFKQMSKHLPADKVIPVYHQNDDVKWLKRYLKEGVKYIGISPANDRTTKQKMKWLKEVEKTIGLGGGELKVKTHGFAVTSFDLMKCWHWHSVDSASWALSAAFGNIFVPRTSGMVYDYYKDPYVLSTSLLSPKTKERANHINTCSPYIKELFVNYITKEIKLPLGESTIVEVEKGYKKQKDEFWCDKTKTKILRIVEPGVLNHYSYRKKANVLFFEQAEKVLPVDNLYLALSFADPFYEMYIDHVRNGLFSYHFIKDKISNEFMYYHNHLQGL